MPAGKKLTVVAFGDPHLTAYPPRWRLDADSFLSTQLFLIERGIQIGLEQSEAGIAVFPGDVFNRRREDHNAALLGLLGIIKNLPSGWKVLTTLGQHDMAAKSVELYETKSALAILEKACPDKIKVLVGAATYKLGNWEFRGCAFGESETAAWLAGERRWDAGEGVTRVLIVHASIGEESVGDWQSAAREISPDCDLVIAGDIHSGISPQKCASGAMVYGAGVLSWMRKDEASHPPQIGLISRRSSGAVKISVELLPHPDMSQIANPEIRDEVGDDDTEAELDKMLKRVQELRSESRASDEMLLEQVCETVKARKVVRRKARAMLLRAKETA